MERLGTQSSNNRPRLRALKLFDSGSVHFTIPTTNSHLFSTTEKKTRESAYRFVVKMDAATASSERADRAQFAELCVYATAAYLKMLVNFSISSL